MKIQDALDLHLKEEASRIIGDKLTKIKMQLAALDLGMAASELLPGSPSVKRAEIPEIGSRSLNPDQS